MNSLLKITLFGIIAIALLLSGCLEEENGENGRAELSFQEGQNKINTIFEKQELSIPDYSKNIFYEEEKIIDAPSLMWNIDIEASKQKLDNVKNSLNEFKNELSQYRQNEDSKALKKYSELLIETINLANNSIETEKEKPFEEIRILIKEMGEMQDDLENCSKLKKEAMELLEKTTPFFNSVKAVGEKAVEFEENYTAQARKANVSKEFTEGFMEKALEAERSKNILSELIPLRAESCEAMQELTILFFEIAFGQCPEPDEREAHLNKVIASAEEILKITDKVIELSEKYPETTEVLSIEEMKQFRQETQEGIKELKEMPIEELYEHCDLDQQDSFCDTAEIMWSLSCGMAISEENCIETDIDNDGVPDCEWVNNGCQRIQGQPIAGNPPECR